MKKNHNHENNYMEQGVTKLLRFDSSVFGCSFIFYERSFHFPKIRFVAFLLHYLYALSC